MITKLRAYDLARLANLQIETRVFKFRHYLPLPEISDITALEFLSRKPNKKEVCARYEFR